MTPAAALRRLAVWLLPFDVREEFLDDLDEAYTRELRRRGPARARRWYAGQLLATFPSFLEMRIRARHAGAPSIPEHSPMTAIDSLTRHLRYAVRHLLAAPAFSLAAILTLALGIGANTAMFSLIRAVVLEPLPYTDPDRLVMVWNALNREGTTWLSMQEVVSYRANSKSLEQLAAYTDAKASFTGGAEPERVNAAAVTANLFDTLGVTARIGRTFAPGDGAPGANPVIVLSYGLWQRRFGGAPNILGQPVQVNGGARLVIGIMPPSFRLPLDYRAGRPTEAWVPLEVDSADLGAWGDRSYFGVGRLRAGVVPATATSEFALISQDWVRAGFVAEQRDFSLIRSAMPMQEFVTGDVRRPLFVLAGAVGLVLLITCANVINLSLARADVRRREVAVRVALGASRGQIVGELLTESLLLAAGGAAVGLLIAQGGLQFLATIGASRLPRLDDVRIDGGVLAFTMALASCAGLIVGLVAALRSSRPDLVGPLKDGGRGGTPSRARVTARRVLVVAQLAGSVMLVVGAMLLVRSLMALHRIDLGYDPRGVLTAQLQLPVASYPQPADVIGFYRRLDERLAALPGVTAAGAVRNVPLTQTIGDWSITIEGRPFRPSENPNGDFQWVTPGFFSTMGLTVLRGRALTPADREDQPPVVVINDTMASRYWPGADAVGQRFRMGGQGSTTPWVTIVGIVRTTRHSNVTETARAEMYLPHAQLPQSIGSPARTMAIVVKTALDPRSLVGPVRDVVRKLDPNLPVSDVRSMADVMATALARPRFATWLLGAFAALALALATVGIYGTISLLVTERAVDMGIRLALGASRRSILALVLRQALAVAAIGIGVGIVGALPLSRLLATLVYGVTTVDPLTFTTVPLVLVAVAITACVAPALRAATVDPVVTLRQG